MHPRLVIDLQEADAYATRMAAYAGHFDTAKMDPKTRDGLLLLGTAAIIEGPRLVTIMREKAEKKQAAKQARDAAVASGLVPPPASAADSMVGLH